MRSMITRTIAAGGACLSAMVVTAAPSAATHFYHGATCNAHTPQGEDYLGRNQYGAYNVAEAGAVHVVCGMVTFSSSTCSAVVHVYDRDSNDKVECWLTDTDDLGARTYTHDETGVVFTGYDYCALPEPAAPLAGNVFVQVRLPKKTANGVSHAIAIEYAD
jgi:hypothetical protein